MSASNEEPQVPSQAHVDQATIEVAQAELYMTPGAQAAAHRLRVTLIWSVIVLFTVVIAIGLANLLWTNAQVHDLQATNASLEHQIRADCGFYRLLAPLPVTVNITTGKPTVLSVQLLSASRVAYDGHGCTDLAPIPPPSPSLMKWAAYYKLPLG